MSGTSLDGLDIAYCEFTEEQDQWSWNILHAETIKYPNSWNKRLAGSMTLSGLELSVLHAELGAYFGECAKNFMDRHSCHPQLISSHGHTIFHQPDKLLTVQVGSGSVIHARTGVPVVCDLRSMDLALGGQGAPLVPVGDKLLFSNYDACLNLGGIANISYEENGLRKAYDIAPCNMTLNWLAAKAGHRYDDQGSMASSGETDKKVLEQLNALPYYHQEPPKSLGQEFVEEFIFPLLKTGSIRDMLHTSVEHSAEQIVKSIRSMKQENPKILVTGGGAYNDFLIDEVRRILGDDGELIVPDSMTIEYKEALVFGLLGVLRIIGRINVLASVTGASSNSCSGAIYG